MGNKGQKTKEIILQKSYELFASKGFKEVSMSDICDITGLSRGGLYRHYSNTSEIFDEIISKEYEIDEFIINGESAKSILNKMLLLIEEEIMAEEASLSLAIYEYASLNNQDFFIIINDRAKERWTKLIKYGIETDEFNDVNIDQIVEMIL